MKKFVIRLFLFVLVYMVLTLSFLFITNDNQSYFSAILDKHKQLKEISQRKAVIIGGSNNAFGIHSALLTKGTGIKTYNASISYFFGLNFILEDIKPFLNANDVVVLIPEYDMFYGDQVDGHIGLYTMLIGNPAGLSHLNYRQWFELPQKLVVMSTERVKGYFKPKTSSHAVYARTSFNADGDMVAHLTQKPTGIHFTPMAIPGTFNEESLTLIHNFITYAHKKKITVLISYPSLAFSAQDDQKIKEVSDSLTHHFSSHLISTPREFIFPDSLFFDDYYHLSSKGRERRSELLLNDIRGSLNTISGAVK